ncbi:beta-eliminating lyase-related protein [Vibrio aestuarianus]|uniref:beta-eliminating lyase-related protein n=1 Tax=Vibrio aestuarianus TaxID=28171 RepID=UPI00237C9B36|nr:beta-eliminating lyase-related protein [Vibrio aestuarianus]MDE1229550.1 beta-eliminating lyase-related protein [Vibrio aestuarianus]
MSKTIHTWKNISLVEESVCLPTGKTVQHTTIVHPGVAVILPITEQGEVILINQYRPSLNKWLLELPAGTIEQGEQPHECAHRELEEETGYSANQLINLGQATPLAGFCDEIQYLFVAKQLTNTARLGCDDDEVIEVDVKEIAQYFDSMTVCLSKGLAAPIGSLLLGSKQYIAKARRLRKMLGGGMRQAGILAAAGKLALTEQVAQLKTDHDNAQHLACGLAKLTGFSVNPDFVQTNIVFAKLDQSIDIDAIARKLAQDGITISPSNPIRFVTHKDVSRCDIDLLLEKLAAYL